MIDDGVKLQALIVQRRRQITRVRRMGIVLGRLWRILGAITEVAGAVMP